MFGVRHAVQRIGLDVPILQGRQVAMTDQAPDPTRAYVAGKLERFEKVIVHAPDRRGRMHKRVRHQKVQSGWTPWDAINYAADRDAVEIFRLAAMLVSLCADEKARGMDEHTLIHLCAGLPCPIGPQVLADTARSLGIPDERARYLVAQLDQEWAATQGLIGGGS